MAGSTGRWLGGMAFEIEQDGHAFILDAPGDSGGADAGPRPKALLLSGLIGCTGMDVVSILARMRVEGFTFRLEASAPLTDGYPSVFGRISLRYVFGGHGLPVEKIRRAVELSQEKYCGVSAMLRAAAPLDWRIDFEDAEGSSPGAAE
ncbi:MAG: OsmC family protein [Candidatus Fermentibacter sp.]|nr:OsmC family protein [Candidatus Fermentibacter sp.]